MTSKFAELDHLLLKGIQFYFLGCQKSTQLHEIIKESSTSAITKTNI